MPVAKTMLAFHGKAALKKKYVARVDRHRRLDQIVKGFYWEGGKGCLVGCSIHGEDHSKFETELGIPQALARIADACFEGSSNAYAMALPGRFMRAAKPGAVLSLVVDKVMLWIVESVAQYNTTDAAKKANTDICNLYKRKIAGDVPSFYEWNAAQAEAEVRAAWAAWATATEAEARAAVWAAEAEARAAKENYYEALADKMIELMEAA